MKAQDAATKKRISQLNEQEAATFNMVIISSLIGILLIITLLIWYSRQLSRRIGSLQGSILSLSALNLSEKDVHATRNDEIGDMANALIKMKHALKGIVSSLRNNADTLASSSEELSSSVEAESNH